jgi:outer membrane immunogenic protein
MRRALLACCGALALLGAAQGVAQTTAYAADLPPRYPAPITKAPIYPPFYNWTGFYIGVNGGGAWGTSGWDSTGDFDLSGGLIGGTIGYNWQTGPWVYGLEGDLDWTNIKGNTVFACPLGCETRNSWLATVRGRVGYAYDRFLPYITGGLALGNIEARRPFFAGNDETNVGWTVGAGVEFAITNNWTAKAEYLFVNLGDISCGFACSGFATDNVSFESHIVRGGINYRF